MTRVIAVHTIHKVVTPGKAKTATEKAVKPVVDIIAPGTVMNVSGAWEEELRSAGAIRNLERGETVPVDVSKLPIKDEDDEEALAAKIAAQEEAMAKTNKGKAKGKAKTTEAENLV